MELETVLGLARSLKLGEGHVRCIVGRWFCHVVAKLRVG